MDNGVPDNSTMLKPIGMDFPRWAGGSGSFSSVASQTFDVGNKSFPNAPQEGFDQFRYVCNAAIFYKTVDADRASQRGRRYAVFHGTSIFNAPPAAFASNNN